MCGAEWSRLEERRVEHGSCHLSQQRPQGQGAHKMASWKEGVRGGGEGTREETKSAFISAKPRVPEENIKTGF